MDQIFNKMDYKWIGLEQKQFESRKLDFLPTPTENGDHMEEFNPYDQMVVNHVGPLAGHHT